MARLCTADTGVCIGPVVAKKCDKTIKAEMTVNAHASGGQMKLKDNAEGDHE
jgi:hypothetical protein